MPACYCTYFKCNGQFVDIDTKKSHERYDASQSYHDLAERNHTLICVRNQSLELSETISGSPTKIDKSGTSRTRRARQPGMSGRIAIPTSDPHTLRSLVELEQRAMTQIKAMRTFKSRALVSQPTRVILDEINTHRVGMETTLADVIVLWCQDSSIAKSIREGLKTNLRKSIKEINNLKHALTTTTTTAARGIPIISAERPNEDFIRCLEECSSLLQRSLFQVLVQDSLDHSTRKASNFRLQSLKDDFAKTMDSKLSPGDEKFLRSFPTDIRTARKLLGIPKTVTYACCPACNSLYPPQDEDGVPVYPFSCTSESCRVHGGCDLLKVGSTQDGKSIGVPKRSFVMQDFDDFVARLLSGPGIEAAIRQSQEHMRDETDEIAEDIITADGLRAIKGPDGVPFLSGGQQHELRLLWCLSVDFFNPYHNKIAGKVASVGSVVLSCLLLPPDMRHKPENLCLVGIIPGPREPSGEEIDNFLRPLVNVMKQSWVHGKIYMTHDYPQGRLVRSAIGLSVNDLPMARKIMGVANYVDKNALKEESPNSIRPRTLQRVQEEARKWQTATSQKARKRLYTKTGIRHSVLMELEYWDPTTMVPVDCMHLFFLGLLQHHARTVLGMDSVGTRNLKVTSTMTKQLEHARKMLHTSPESFDLATLTVDVLQILCEEMGVNVKRLKEPRKGDLIDSLKASLSKGGTNCVSNIIGEGIVQEIAQDRTDFKTLLAMGISPYDLKVIRDDIAATIRPRWHAAPPDNLGQVSHGKLKADEWRSCFEFDIPVSLLWIETRSRSTATEADTYRAKLVHSTFLLAIAIRWATSHRMTARHIEEYTKTMKDYLKTLKEFRPTQRFRPNHVNALLVGDYLRLYGPIRSWWMFPFERVIGDLQRIKTNNKPGEMEKTMFAAFSASSFMQATLQRLSGSDGWKDSIAVRERSLRAAKGDDMSKAPRRAVTSRLKPLDEDIQAAMKKAARDLRRELASFHCPEEANFQDRVTIRGHEFTTYRTSESHGVIFFQDAAGSNSLVPGVIRAIFLLAQDSKDQLIFLAVHRYLTPPTSLPDPFIRYPDFGANLWSSETSREVTIVPGTRDIYHAIYRGWDHKIMVMKPLNRDF